MKRTLYVVTLLVAAVCMAEDKAATPKSPATTPHPEGQRGHFVPQHVPKEILEKFDKDGDGKLNEAEAKAAREARQAEMLKKYDKDGDGKLSEAELKTARDERQAEMLKKFDKDGDGKISDEERQAAREAFMKNHPAGKGGHEGKSDKPKEEKK